MFKLGIIILGGLFGGLSFEKLHWSGVFDYEAF